MKSSDFVMPSTRTPWWRATFAAKDLKAKTAVIYVDNSSDYSKSLAKVFREKFEAAGGKVVAVRIKPAEVWTLANRSNL